MAVIFIRTILIYILLLAVMRISGKRQIGEIQISELVTTFLLSDIASYPLTNPGIPILNAVIPIFTIIPLEIIFSFLTTKCARLKKLLDGKPSIVILHGKIQKKEMERLRLSMDDLLCELRLKSIASVDDVDYAILEQNGQISVFEKNKAPLSHAVIIDGTLNTQLLKQIGKNKHWLQKILKSVNIQEYRDVFLLSVTDDGNITLIKQKQLEEKKNLS
ncbi:MAG: DUF421 domain-containing protein [Ruminococcaceae bacterium]|nr:DUF421 domain-containing protein [Oscillospiraceae bacterium]